MVLLLALLVTAYFLIPRMPQARITMLYTNGTSQVPVMWADVEILNMNYLDMVSSKWQ
jgi:hypothetical protein